MPTGSVQSAYPSTLPRTSRVSPARIAPGRKPSHARTIRRIAMTGLRYGGPAPDFTLPSTGGGTVTLSALKGSDVVLVFYCYDFGSI